MSFGTQIFSPHTPEFLFRATQRTSRWQPDVANPTSWLARFVDTLVEECSSLNRSAFMELAGIPHRTDASHEPGAFACAPDA